MIGLDWRALVKFCIPYTKKKKGFFLLNQKYKKNEIVEKSDFFLILHFVDNF